MMTQASLECRAKKWDVGRLTPARLAPEGGSRLPQSMSRPPEGVLSLPREFPATV
jgi:hypothetical protein